MPKDTLFRFKQFTLQNTGSAMKVNTDGVLLGAWAPVDNVSRIWDVGTGSGVIALMLAQRSAAAISCIEIDPEAAGEAQRNIDASPWRDRLSTHCADITDIAAKLPQPDLIVSNPPYFTAGLHNLESPDPRKALARHQTTLSYRSLIDIAALHLAPHGRLAFISPTDRQPDIELAISLSGMHIESLLSIRTSPAKPLTRILWLISRKPCALTRTELTLRDASRQFSTEYRDLLSEFYINF